MKSYLRKDKTHMNNFPNKRIIFLSGPMRGVPRSEGIAWREKAGKLLGNGFLILQAYRGREEKETFPDSRLAVIRDKQDINRADIVIVNDSVPNTSMIGTAMEVFYAHSLNKVVILFGDVHPKDYWLNYHSHARVATLEEACELVKRMFCV